MDSLPLDHVFDGHAPWLLLAADVPTWERMIEALAAGEATLLSVWADSGCVHMAVLTKAEPDGTVPNGAMLNGTVPPIMVVTLDCPPGRCPSVGRLHASAIRLERAVRDLSEITPEGLPDTRPWLDQGRWDDEARPAAPYSFLPFDGEALHQIPVGPVHAGIIEPDHLRFTADGETAVRLEEQLGSVHKGIDVLLAGASVPRARRIAGRVSGDSTVAYALAFSQAAEAALPVGPPPRAVWLRAVMAEMERTANHLGYVGAIRMMAHCAVLRKQILRCTTDCFGHRLMMDRIMPGGVSVDLDAAGVERIRALTHEIGTRFHPLVSLYDGMASLRDRTVTTDILRPELTRRFGAGGYVGRASGRSFDAR